MTPPYSLTSRAHYCNINPTLLFRSFPAGFTFIQRPKRLLWWRHTRTIPLYDILALYHRPIQRFIQASADRQTNSKCQITPFLQFGVTLHLNKMIKRLRDSTAARPLPWPLNVTSAKKFAKCIWQSHLLWLQVNSLAPPRRSSLRLHSFKYAQFVPCLDEVWGLLGAIRTVSPTPSLPVAFKRGCLV